MKRTPAETLALRSERQGDCLIWTGAKDSGGYGMLTVDMKNIRAHRMAWLVNHNHVTRDIRPPGTCPACDEHHDRAMNVPVCYARHEPMPGVHQDVPHLNTQCMEAG